MFDCECGRRKHIHICVVSVNALIMRAVSLCVCRECVCESSLQRESVCEITKITPLTFVDIRPMIRCDSGSGTNEYERKMMGIL